jgi:SH3-like domain-containing protein
MIVRAFVVLCLAALALPAKAQTSPPAGTLHVPTKAERTPAPPAKPPSAAPVTSVQQVAPLSTPATKPAKPTAEKKKPPVIAPAHSSHAQKPAAAKQAVAKPTATPPPVPATPSPTPPAASGEKPAEPAKGSITGLPLPRWASFRSDEVNLRAGPGTRYPVDWVYRRRGLPVEIEREFEVWRLVRDQDGVRGWVHQATLTGRRDFVVAGGEHTLRSSAADTAAAVAMLKPGVIGRIRDCAVGKKWCEVQVGDYRGWLKRDDLWGAYPDEAVN